jgi:hypothetical protein
MIRVNKNSNISERPPAPTPTRPTVRKLVWSDESPNSAISYVGVNSECVYEIFVYAHQSHIFFGHLLIDSSPPNMYDAKETAQAHYNALILDGYNTPTKGS